MVGMTLAIARLRVWNPETCSPDQVREAAAYILGSVTASPEDIAQASAMLTGCAPSKSLSSWGILREAASETEWDADSMLSVLCEFVDSHEGGSLRPALAAYVRERVAEEGEDEDFEEEGEEGEESEEEYEDFERSKS